MPWIAEHKGNQVTPQDVSSRDHIVCPECGNEMHVRGPYSRSDGGFVARHFSHNPTDTPTDATSTQSSCGGESDEHNRMKSIAFSKLKHLFGETIETIKIELAVGDTGKNTDVGVIFTDDIDSHESIVTAACITGAVGNRVAVEVQYGNKSKDIQGTARTYAENGYTTLWLYPEQFSKFDVELFEGSGAVWTPVYPEITRSDINFPVKWDHHAEQIQVERPNSEVEACFPVEWYETELQKHLAATGPNTQYERWSCLFPDITDKFIELAEDVLTNPEQKGRLLLDTLYPTLDPGIMTNYYGNNSIPLSEVVCGNCRYAENDAYRDTDNAIICWKNQPEMSGNLPRKLTLTDDFAQECPHFSFDTYRNDEVLEIMDLHDRLKRPKLLKSLAGAEGVSRRERRKDALKFAYYHTWGGEDWNDYPFSPGREEGFLRYLESSVSASHRHGCATKGQVVMPFDECSGCGRKRHQLRSDEELLVEVAVGEQVQDWICGKCRDLGRGLS